MQHRRREPAPGVLRLVLPLPFPVLPVVNAYLIVDAEGHTLVDCGIRHPHDEPDHGFAHLERALAAAGATVEDVRRLVVTHPHADHYGLAARVVEASGCSLWMHRDAGEELDGYLDAAGAAARLKETLSVHGVSSGDIDELAAFEDWRAFVWGVVEPTEPVGDGEAFTAGGRRWEAVHTPGHARAHICLWAVRDRILVSGDHVLQKITPHIDVEHGGRDPLGDYLESLDRIDALDPALVLPGHGRPFESGGRRARAIARHHERRLGAILQVVRNTPRTASEITDEVFGPELLHFQRRLALGEALAHLVYLRERGEVEVVRRPDGTSAYVRARRK